MMGQSSGRDTPRTPSLDAPLWRAELRTRPVMWSWGAGADERRWSWPDDRSEVELQIVISGSGFTLTPSELLCALFLFCAFVFGRGDWRWSWVAEGVNQSPVTPSENPLRVKNTTANITAGSAQGGSGSPVEMRLRGVISIKFRQTNV